MHGGRNPAVRLFEDELIIERDSGRFVPGRSASPATQVQPGQRLSPSTEIKPGQRFNRATEFQPGRPAKNKLAVGAETIRTAKRTGKRRAYIKIAEPNVWIPRAVFVWESKNGPLPRGSVVHHRDRDSLNDEPENLVGLTRNEHAAEHRGELLQGAVAAFHAARAA